MNSEQHPLEPFLPENARLLMLGSFPPKRIRWSMEFFYPNLQNDMWRIVGYLAFRQGAHRGVLPRAGYCALRYGSGGYPTERQRFG